MDFTLIVVAALELRDKIKHEAGISVSIGVTSGTAYSGFVGSTERREMCVMGRCAHVVCVCFYHIALLGCNFCTSANR